MLWTSVSQLDSSTGVIVGFKYEVNDHRPGNRFKLLAYY